MDDAEVAARLPAKAASRSKAASSTASCLEKQNLMK
jgi:hypothetical protein